MRLITPRIRMTIVLLAIVMLVYWLGAAIHGRSVPTREAAEQESRTSICESLAVTSSLLIQEGKSPLTQDYINQLMSRNPKFRSLGVRDQTGKLVVSTPNHKSVWADPTVAGDRLNVPLKPKHLLGLVLIYSAPFSCCAELHLVSCCTWAAR